MLICRYHLHFKKSLEFAVPQRGKFEASFCTLVNLCHSVLLLFARRACVFYGTEYACSVIWVRVKIQGMDQGPGPTHTIHTPRSIPWSIPHDTAWSIPLIHTPDPYPWSVPLSRWRKTDAGPNAAFILLLLLVLVLLLPLLLPLFLLLPPLPPLAASVLPLLPPLLLLLPLLVIFLPGAAATAVASAAAPAGPAPAAGADSLPPCASGSWTNATSWLATSNTASAPWTLVRPVLVPLGASCTSTAIAGKQAQIACPDPYPDPYPFHTRSIPEPSHATTNANMKVRFCYYFYCCCFCVCVCFCFCFYFYFYYFFFYYYYSYSDSSSYFYSYSYS